MKKSEENHIVDLADFDQSISLYQMIPAGSGKGLMLLKKIVEYILTAKPTRIPSILITGAQGIRTHARAFLRALAIEDVRETDGLLLQPCSALIDYFRNPSPDTGYIIAGAYNLDKQVQPLMIDVLTNQKFNMYNFVRESKETYSVQGLLVLTTRSINLLPPPMRQIFDYIIEIESYTNDQKILIGLQRIKYCGIGYRSEEVLEEIVMRTNGNLRQMIHLLQIAITLISAEGRMELDIQDIRKAADLLPQPNQSKS
jgi:hypothetical protein